MSKIFTGAGRTPERGERHAVADALAPASVGVRPRGGDGLADRLRNFPRRGSSPAPRARRRRDLWRRGLCDPAARDTYRSAYFATGSSSQLHDHGRWPAGRPRKSRPDRDDVATPARLRGGRLVGSRRLGLRQFVADGPGLPAQRALPNGAVQHALSLWSRTRRRLPTANWRQPAQAATRSLLGTAARSRRGDPRHPVVLARCASPRTRTSGSCG